MNWIDAIASELISEQSSCQMIIVGETADGQPFCVEDGFLIRNLSEQQFTAALPYEDTNPLQNLDRVNFIEFSFYNNGVLYYSFVELLNKKTLEGECLLELAAPELLYTSQNRRFPRATLTDKLPIRCEIIGLRKKEQTGGTAFLGQMVDISGGGLSFFCSNKLFYPLLLRMRFHLPVYEDGFEVTGEVVRVTSQSGKGYRIAVEFRNAPESAVSLINAYATAAGG
ncbi:PilZ domain-containing protein [Paenibacillus gansuensis]|uniref:PilZ domain-containing protein n=1 Tax=Paenibacillus gansuensis TaxID=306542 RepID=A0ABW5PGP4_9BACL